MINRLDKPVPVFGFSLSEFLSRKIALDQIAFVAGSDEVRLIGSHLVAELVRSNAGSVVVLDTPMRLTRVEFTIVTLCGPEQRKPIRSPTATGCRRGPAGTFQYHAKTIGSQTLDVLAVKVIGSRLPPAGFGIEEVTDGLRGKVPGIIEIGWISLFNPHVVPRAVRSDVFHYSLRERWSFETDTRAAQAHASAVKKLETATSLVYKDKMNVKSVNFEIQHPMKLKMRSCRRRLDVIGAGRNHDAFLAGSIGFGDAPLNRVWGIRGNTGGSGSRQDGGAGENAE